MDTIHEVRPGSGEDSLCLIYGLDKRKTCAEITIQRLKLVSLNISTILIDRIEEVDNDKLTFEDARLLQGLSADLNDIVSFMNNELIHSRSGSGR
jgi:hypothetical protein